MIFFIDYIHKHGDHNKTIEFFGIDTIFMFSAAPLTCGMNIKRMGTNTKFKRHLISYNAK